MSLRPSGTAMVAGVVGSPIGHSLSPLLHAAWIEAAGLDAVYAPFAPGDGKAFEALIRGLAKSGVRGVNVTLPYKAAALALADRADEAASSAGAANLLLFRDGAVEARNTDGIGLIAALKAMSTSLDLPNARVVLLGAGGAARGAAVALRGAGAGSIRIVNRTPERAQAVADIVGGEAIPMARAGEAFEHASILINSTSAGVAGGDEPAWSLQALPTSALAFDMRYGAQPTAFLAQARTLGLNASDGLVMLIEQAKPSFEAFFGVASPPEVDAERLLREALR